MSNKCFDAAACRADELLAALAEAQAERDRWAERFSLAVKQDEENHAAQEQRIADLEARLSAACAEVDTADDAYQAGVQAGVANTIKLIGTVADILIANKPGAAWNAVHEEEKEIVAVLERMRAAGRAAERERIGTIVLQLNHAVLRTAEPVELIEMYFNDAIEAIRQPVTPNIVMPEGVGPGSTKGDGQ